ncbi:dipeptidyl peptidase [Acrasis kona]|uniref:dipeptidyl-peptidase I n=1 Tax=Acrasis kona TaxID=1008807 RepID=A0AAW2ZAS9_9EUKA
MKKVLILIVAVICLVGYSLCDLPVHCMPDKTPGEWSFQLTEQNLSKEQALEKCQLKAPLTPSRKFTVTLSTPTLAKDESGNEGNWHNVYDQGFELVIGGNKYFAFFEYAEQGRTIVSKCGNTFTGLYHEAAVGPKKWGCYKATKTSKVEPSVFSINEPVSASNEIVTANEINKLADTWTATDEYTEDYESKLVPLRRFKALIPDNKLAIPIPAAINKDLPSTVDWRNVSGVNYVSPVRNQASCGSCFSFASTAALEARINIASKNTKHVVLSPQDIVSCSPYSQGCNGGFPYLVFKYGEDFGLQTEECYTYEAADTKCTKDKCPGNKRNYVTDYQYIGGYVGGSNEQNIMEALTHGPVVLNFLVYADFTRYRGGIYIRKSTVIKGGHSVLGVGYGEENGQKYWIVKNSWGGDWGENGFFKIRRGADEAGIESMGPSFATPVI